MRAKRREIWRVKRRERERGGGRERGTDGGLDVNRAKTGFKFTFKGTVFFF